MVMVWVCYGHIIGVVQIGIFHSDTATSSLLSIPISSWKIKTRKDGRLCDGMGTTYFCKLPTFIHHYASFVIENNSAWCASYFVFKSFPILSRV